MLKSLLSAAVIASTIWICAAPAEAASPNSSNEAVMQMSHKGMMSRRMMMRQRMMKRHMMRARMHRPMMHGRTMHRSM